MMKALNALIVRSMPLVPKPIVRRIASRYVAGDTLEQALGTVRALNAEGCMVTLDVLGEDIADMAETEATVAEYRKALDAIAAEGLDANVSVKLTALGLKLDPAGCRRQLARILETARSQGNFVRIDMEDSSVTEETLSVFYGARASFERVGVALQAYLRRTAADVRRAAETRANIRLCKGIYVEPAAIAFQGRQEIRDSYAAAAETLLASGCYVGLATHDEWLVERALSTIRRLVLPPGAYEFQMLLGVAAPLRRRLIALGHRLRVYVPYGAAWEAYSMRRLKENPAIAGHVFTGLFSGR